MKRFGEIYYNKTYQGSSSGTGIWKGIEIDARSGKLAYRTGNNDTQMNSDTILKIPVSGDCSVTITCTNADNAKKIIMVSSQQDIPIDYSGNNAIISYIGSDTVQITVKRGTSDDSSKSLSTYLTSIEVTYDSSIKPKPDYGKGPHIALDGELYGSKEDSVTVSDNGQRLTITQTDGDGFVGAGYGDSNFDQVGYYVFSPTTEYDTLSFDMKVTASSTSSAYGVFAGIFTREHAYTAGFRGSKAIQKVYSSSSKYTNNTGIGETSYALDEKFHIEIARTAEKECKISFYSYSNQSHQGEYECDFLDETGTELYYGIALSQATAEISNMVYTKKTSASDAGEISYNQNDYYYPVGAIPTPRALYATITELNGATVVKLSIVGDTPSGDGFYVLERLKQGETDWVNLTGSGIYDTTFIDDTLPAGAEGTYVYRICGQLGRESLGGDRSEWGKSKEVIFDAALARPVVTITGSQTGITLSWTCEGDPDYYTIYRYSYDQGYENKQIIRRKETGTTYTDTVASGGLVQDDPYFYIVQAIKESPYNESLVAEDAAVWSVSPSKRTGYDYETNDIVITRRSYQTVFTDEITIEGLVNGSGGTIKAFVNLTIMCMRHNMMQS